MKKQRSVARQSQPSLRADARRNYESLLDVAKKAFEREGMSASLDGIAADAGVGIGTLYRHFPTRQRLAQAVFADDVRALARQADALDKAADPLKALQTWLDSFVEHVSTFRGISALVAGGLCKDPEASDAISALLAAAIRLVERAKKERMVAPNLEASDLMTLANAVGWAASEAKDDALLGRRLLAWVMAGISTPRR